MSTTTMTHEGPAHLRGLLRHFADLRDGKHGDHAVRREDKERLFAVAVELLDAHARRALNEMNGTLLLGSGTISATGVVRTSDGGVVAAWTLIWPALEARRLRPVTLEAAFEKRFHHPHLRGATVGTWPLNVFTAEDAAAELPTLRAIAGADLHNLVFQSDFSIIPAVMQG